MNTFVNLTQAEEDEMIQKEFQALLQDYAATRHKQKVEIITRAFEFANKAHKGTKRRSGEPYIMHPLSVARIVVKEIGLGSTSICSALLHDVVEDTDYTCEDIEELFGPKIASIVSGLTKISGGIFGDKNTGVNRMFKIGNAFKTLVESIKTFATLGIAQDPKMLETFKIGITDTIYVLSNVFDKLENWKNKNSVKSIENCLNLNIIY